MGVNFADLEIRVEIARTVFVLFKLFSWFSKHAGIIQMHVWDFVGIIITRFRLSSRNPTASSLTDKHTRFKSHRNVKRHGFMEK